MRTKSFDPFFENLDYKVSGARLRINSFARKWFNTSWKLSIEKWWNESNKFSKRMKNFENREFSKTMEAFSHYQSIRILTHGAKAKILKWHTFLKVDGFSIETSIKELLIKELNIAFPEESELQILGISILILVLGISVTWASLNYMSWQMHTRTKFVFSGTLETRAVKNGYQ